MAFDIETSFIRQPDAERLYRDFPKLEKGPDQACPTCGGFKHYFWKGENHPCNCARQLQLHKHYLVSGIGVTYQRLDWSDYEGDPEVVDQLMKYLDGHTNFVGRGIGLLLSGSYGSGKTMLATLLLKELVKVGYRCMATTFSETVEAFTAGWKSMDDQRYFREKFVNSDVLLLDDLGREFRSKNSLNETTFDNLLRSRVQGGRPTFITTNMSMDELEDGYGGAAISLLREVCLEYNFPDDVEDFRPKSQKRALEELSKGEIRPII